MSTRIPKLLEIYQEILQEVGDLKNIEPYPYTRVEKGVYETTLETGEELSILLENAEEWQELGLLQIPSSINIKKTDKIYNLGFGVNDSDSQQKKATLPILFRILKTVLVIAEEFLRNNPNTFLVIFPEDKVGEKETQKRDYYLEILAKQDISGYIRGEVKLQSKVGTIFGPFRRKTSKNQHEFR